MDCHRPKAIAPMSLISFDDVRPWARAVKQKVVDTTNVSEKVSFRGASKDLHAVERFTRVDANTILYRFTIDDPITFSRPWTGELPMRATDEMLYEHACHEANHSLFGILSGARFEECTGRP